MLSKLCTGDQQSKGRSQLKRRFRIFSSKMTGSGPVSPYERMDSDVKTAKKKKKARLSEVGDGMDKENNNLKEVKDKKVKKKRSWKRFRQAALTTCRYIGLGVAHMSPATVHSAPDYYIDPKYWDKSFNPKYNHRPQQNTRPHWTSNMMFTAGF